jgi:hypothetical protein
MAIDTHKYSDRIEREARHSALEEFSRDERRPAVLLLSALVLAVLFFAIGLLVGRWTAEPSASLNATASSAATPVATPAAAEPTPQPATNTAVESAPNVERRFTLLVATYDAPEKAQTLINALQDAGYTDIRTNSPRANETRPRYSVLVGHFTPDEAHEAIRRMRSANDPRLKNAKVIKEQ